MSDIKEITPLTLPFGLDDKIFFMTDEDGQVIGAPYSLNDWDQMLVDISGVNEELLGRKE